VSKDIGIIPARGGSERVKDKNIAYLHGEPLIFWTIKAMQESDVFSNIIISTDSDAIAETCFKIADQLGVGNMNIMARPEELRGPKPGVYEVVAHVINDMVSGVDFRDRIYCLQATCPFRRASSINYGRSMLSPEAPAFVSGVKFEHPVGSVLNVDDQGLWHVAENRNRFGNSQDVKGLWRVNGAIEGAYVWYFVANDNSFFGPNTRLLPMNKVDSLDINDQLDFNVATAIMRNREPSKAHILGVE